MLNQGRPSGYHDKFFHNGLKIRMSDGGVIWVQVNPDVSNPIQCYHCFEFGKHMAQDCKNLRAKLVKSKQQNLMMLFW